MIAIANSNPSLLLFHKIYSILSLHWEDWTYCRFAAPFCWILAPVYSYWMFQVPVGPCGPGGKKTNAKRFLLKLWMCLINPLKKSPHDPRSTGWVHDLPSLTSKNTTWTSKSSWWLNQPLWKICSSKWVHLPQGSGWKQKIFELPPPSLKTIHWILIGLQRPTEILILDYYHPHIIG